MHGATGPDLPKANSKSTWLWLVREGRGELALALGEGDMGCCEAPSARRDCGFAGAARLRAGGTAWPDQCGTGCMGFRGGWWLSSEAKGVASG